MDNIAKLKFPTAQDFLTQYEKFESDIASYADAHEQRMLLCYLLHSLRIACGLYDKVFDDNVAVQDPDYRFLDSGQILRGSAQAIEYLKSEAELAALLTIPRQQRIAVAEWGFASEQVSHIILGSSSEIQQSKKSLNNKMVQVECVKLAMVWRCNAQGQMESVRFYPAKARAITAVSRTEVDRLHDARKLLQDTIPRIEQKIRSFTVSR